MAPISPKARLHRLGVLLCLRRRGWSEDAVAVARELGSVSTAALDLARLSPPVPQWVVEPLLRTVLREHGLQLPDGTPSDQQRLRYLLVAFIRGAASLDEVEGPLYWAVVDAQEPTPPQRKLISAAEEWQAAPAPERRRIAERVRREVAVHLDLGQL